MKLLKSNLSKHIPAIFKITFLTLISIGLLAGCTEDQAQPNEIAITDQLRFSISELKEYGAAGPEFGQVSKFFYDDRRRMVRYEFTPNTSVNSNNSEPTLYSTFEYQIDQLIKSETYVFLNNEWVLSKSSEYFYASPTSEVPDSMEQTSYDPVFGRREATIHYDYDRSNKILEISTGDSRDIFSYDSDKGWLSSILRTSPGSQDIETKFENTLIFNHFSMSPYSRSGMVLMHTTHLDGHFMPSSWETGVRGSQPGSWANYDYVLDEKDRPTKITAAIINAAEPDIETVLITEITYRN